MAICYVSLGTLKISRQGALTNSGLGLVDENYFQGLTTSTLNQSSRLKLHAEEASVLDKVIE